MGFFDKLCSMTIFDKTDNKVAIIAGEQQLIQEWSEDIAELQQQGPLTKADSARVAWMQMQIGYSQSKIGGMSK